MRINLGFFHLESWKRKNPYEWVGTGCWFRFFGWGLHFTNAPLIFSERMGLQKIIKLPFGYRVKLLKRGK